jgi:hypothetical protein
MIKIGDLVTIKNDSEDTNRYYVTEIYDDGSTTIITESGAIEWDDCFLLDELELV